MGVPTRQLVIMILMQSMIMGLVFILKKTMIVKRNCLATLITAGGGFWQNEIGWQILSCDESIILEGGAPVLTCVDLPDNYSVMMTDSWGDGWDGNYLVVGDEDFYTIEYGYVLNLDYAVDVQIQKH